MNLDDMATQQEEFARDAALRHRKAELPKIGSCYNCGEAVKPSANYCDADCRVDHERRTQPAKGK